MPEPSDGTIGADDSVLQDPAFRALVDAVRELSSGHLAMVTGAGVSLASGIPTFRGDDEGAVWKDDILEMGTFRFFRSDPVASWVWTREKFSKIPGAEPNPAHTAMARLHRSHEVQGGKATTLTQNIDTLHQKAGSTDVINVHGTVERVRCATDGCANGSPRGSLDFPHAAFEAFYADPGFETLPKCDVCGDVLRQHVLWFDEFYAEHEDYQWERVQDTIRTMDLLLFVGTSFSVGVTDAFLSTALMRGVPVFLVDPGSETPVDQLTHVKAKAEIALPALCAALGW